jgi:hypothetical protein
MRDAFEQSIGLAVGLVLLLGGVGTLMLFVALNAALHWQDVASMPAPQKPWPAITSADGIAKALVFLIAR